MTGNNDDEKHNEVSQTSNNNYISEKILMEEENFDFTEAPSIHTRDQSTNQVSVDRQIKDKLKENENDKSSTSEGLSLNVQKSKSEDFNINPELERKKERLNAKLKNLQRKRDSNNVEFPSIQDRVEKLESRFLIL